MIYRITHVTQYEYADIVPFCQNIVFLTPRSMQGQNCSRHRLTVHPQPATLHRQTDYFGNTKTCLSIDEGHRLLKISATSTVELQPAVLPLLSTSAAWESIRDGLPIDTTPDGLANYQFVFGSPHVSFHEQITEYARQSFADGRPILEAVADFNSRIHGDMAYDPRATTVSTPITEVFESRRGVCQDLAHLMLSGLRSLGLAARYVSGYLRTCTPDGSSGLVGADASHAWVSVYCGDLGWIDVDPTNNIFPSGDHITVAYGRDFSDVCPVLGMFIGGGDHSLRVEVEVAPVSD